MKILIAADFFAEFELYETSDPAGLAAWIKQAATEAEPGPLDNKKYRLLASHDNMTTEEARALADHVLFTSDF